MNPHSILSNAFAKSGNAMMPSNWCFFDKYITSSTVLKSAYKTHHSTETTLVKVFNDIMLNVDSGLGSFLILLDLSSAFDTIDYDLLCTVFERHLGISGTALKLLKSFLTGRSQAVIIDGVKSELKKTNLWRTPGVSTRTI